VAAFTVVLWDSYPLEVALTLVPAFIVLFSFHWLDMLDPEPWEFRIRAFLWGASVAVLGSLVANEFTAYIWSSDVAAITSAPVAEETLKILGIAFAYKSGRIRSALDGAIYAGFTAAGFALVENFIYFSSYSELGYLLPVFIGRGLATPFAHPLFSVSAGLLIGMRSRVPAALRACAGLLLAVGLHASFNATLTFTTEETADVLAGAWILTFMVTLAALVRLRGRRIALYRDMSATLAFTYNMNPVELAMFADWRGVQRLRRTITGERRRAFNDLHSVVLRIGEYHSGKQEQRHPELVGELDQARLRWNSAMKLRPPTRYPL
jgi:RsiW-degrading membrane proteinase PrsW (M82 family)